MPATKLEQTSTALSAYWPEPDLPKPNRADLRGHPRTCLEIERGSPQAEFLSVSDI
ncbi:hypothetical protein [Pelagicoccus albus]|uniref:Uncharacterized protein n=1 Tax=Pelagicoccus albus TaxID=415222 RepID=A0A7X1B5H5_9BACT|nr:hypothetical protein [Pelagicoccus albus]MBC2605754.1 hypothetical protein [Pelagicoccus albus]